MGRRRLPALIATGAGAALLIVAAFLPLLAALPGTLPILLDAEVLRGRRIYHPTFDPSRLSERQAPMLEPSRRIYEALGLEALYVATPSERALMKANLRVSAAQVGHVALILEANADLFDGKLDERRRRAWLRRVRVVWIGVGAWLLIGALALIGAARGPRWFGWMHAAMGLLILAANAIVFGGSGQVAGVALTPGAASPTLALAGLLLAFGGVWRALRESSDQQVDQRRGEQGDQREELRDREP